MLVLIIAVSCTAIIFGVLAVVLLRNAERRSWWGLLLTAIPIICALLAIFLAVAIQHQPTISGFPNWVLFPASALPLFPASYAFVLWRKSPKREQ